MQIRLLIVKKDMNEQLYFDNNKNIFICNIYNDTFSHKLYLYFLHEICIKGFYHKQNLNKHLNTYAEEQSFVGEVCGKGFSLMHSLNSHPHNL